MRYAYISLGSNTTVKSGSGRLFGVLAGGPGMSGGSVFAVDSTSIGATPNYVTQRSNSSNLADIGPLPATVGATFDLMGIGFEVGLTVAATSNTDLTVIYD